MWGRRAPFEELVAEAIDGLPDWVRRAMDNVEVFVEEDAPDDQPWLLGLYQGVPLSRRGTRYGGAVPDRITLYRSSIKRSAGDDRRALRVLVARTVAHEVAHHFGISDDRLRELDVY